MSRIGSREARLTLRLVDAVSRPARAAMASLTGLNTRLTGITSAAMAPARAVSGMARTFRASARDMSVGSIGMAIGLGRAGRLIYDMEDTINEIEGRRFGTRDTFALANGIEMGRLQFRQSVIDLVSEVTRTTPRAADEILKSYNQLVQAGLNHEQVHAILPTAIDFAIAGNYDTEEAADRLTNVMTSMRLPMATMDEAQASALRAADVIAYAANSTNSDIRQMTEAFKYAAPSASALGISVEQLAAMFVIQARRGIKASEAGVSIRAMFTRMVRPTNMAAAALERYGIDLSDYLERSEEVSGRNVADALGFGGLDASSAVGEIDAILQQALSTGEKVQRVTAAVMKSVGDDTTMSAQSISDAVTEVLFGFGEQLDVERLIGDMQAAGIAMGDFFRIFDVRQGARTLALFGDDLSKWVGDISDNADGFAEALRKTRMQGVVGAWQRTAAAVREGIRAIADSGVLARAVGLLENITGALQSMAKANPRLLEFGTYAILAAAVLAPLGFMLSGITAALAIMINPLTWVIGGLATLAGIHFGPLTWFFRALGNIFRNNLKPEILDGIGTALDHIRSGFRGLSDFGADGEAWARTTKVWGENMAAAANAVYETVTRLIGTRFVQEYAEGFANAFRNIADAARWLAKSMQTLGIEMQPVLDLLDTDFAAGLGSFLGTMTGYGVAFALAAAGIAIVAWPLRRVASALAFLSGVKLAWPVLRFLGRLALLALSAAAIGSLAASVRALGGATAKTAGAEKGREQPTRRTGGRFAGLGRTALGALGGKWALGAVAAWEAGKVSMGQHGRGPDSEGMDDRLWESVQRQKVDTLRGDLLDSTEGWSQAASRSIADYVAALARGGSEAEEEANRIGQQIIDELSVTGNPDVNTGRLERALGIARELAGAIRSINGGESASGGGGRRFGGGRAKGGPVHRGLTYLVGEEGPELFSPSSSGNITSNRKLGGGGLTIQGPLIGSLSVQGGSTEEVMKRIGRELEQALTRSWEIALDGRSTV